MRQVGSIIFSFVAFLFLFTIPVGAYSLKVTWNANTETDLAGYKVYYGLQSRVYGTPVNVGKTTGYQISNVQSGKTYYIAVTAYNTSNIESAYSTELSIPVPASTPSAPPTGSISINSGAASTTSRSVTLTLSAGSTGSTVTGMKFSNDGITFSSETAYAASYTWSLSSGYGTKTVYVLFKDATGLWSTAPAIDTIQYSAPATTDTTPPTGTVRINSGAASTTSRTVTLNLNAADTGGSVTGMKFSNDTVTWSGEVAFAASYQWTLSSGYGTKTVYALFKDSSGNWMKTPVSAGIQYVSSAPVAKAGTNKNVLPQRVILDGSASYDPGGKALQYSWTQVSGPVSVIIETPASPEASFLAIKAGTYQFRLTCSNGTGSASATVSISVQNTAPGVSAGGNMVVDAGTKITLHADGTDSNEDALTYKWTKVSGPSVTLPGLSQQNIAFTPTNSGWYKFTVQCSDGVNTSAASQILIRVNGTYRAPTANAGMDQVIPKGTLVTLNGADSLDPNGRSLRYSWVQVSGPAGTLSGANTVKPSFTTASTGNYEFDLTVNNGYVSSLPDRVSVRVVSQNNPPVAVTGPAIHANVGDDVILNASSSYDPDNSPLTFTWKQVSGAPVVIFNAGTAKPFFTPTSSGVYEFKVTVSDGQVSATDSIIVTADNEYQVPLASAGDPSVNINAVTGTTVTLNGTGSRDPDGSAISYIWNQTDGPMVALRNPNSATPSVVPALEGIYFFELRVYDAMDTAGPARAAVVVQAKAPAIALLSPSYDYRAYQNPIFKWSGQGFSSYTVRISTNNGNSWTGIYTGSSSSCIMQSASWSFIPSGTKVLWYVEGATNSGQVMKSGYGEFIRK